ncbi:glycosyltransferase family 2 protein [Cribrihabitans neustonicus]|uniref:glycosyltransferase family 2 protein n=1 Tax=Cribrihabitans neustonicus TaxID=1429085 RepID=UPI003B59A5EB
MAAYRLRWKRRRLLWRALRARHQLACRARHTGLIEAAPLLCFSVVRNEAARLPFYLDHYRRAGVGHFLFVDNGSEDGTADLLLEHPDVSLWQTTASYRGSRFGVDWLTWLQIRYGHGKWCLTADADEILTYPHADSRSLRDLTGWLDREGVPAFGALMLDMYPKGPLGQGDYTPGQHPCEVLQWFDAGPFHAVRQHPAGNLWLQGGARERVFFQDEPARSPTLNKIPLVKWNRRYVYLNSTHSLLPPRLNAFYCGPGGPGPSGVLLHTKFLPEVVSRSETERLRGQHFSQPEDFDLYYERIIAGPDLWHPGALRYEGWQQLEALGLMTRGGWN